eukprot:11183782-Lingulodinium_polyedra.AAC.1
MESVHDILAMPDPLKTLAASRRLRLLLQSEHAVTRFATKGVGYPATSSSGARAEDPLGDVIFSGVLLHVLT